jgi:hypothetical protein
MNASFPYADFVRCLPPLLATGRQEAVRRGRAILVSVTVDIPPLEPALLFARMHGQERILWEQPSQSLAMAAFGATIRLCGHGEECVSRITVDWRTLLSHTISDAAPSYPFPPPLSLGGFAFYPARRTDPGWEEYPDALLVTPRFLFLTCQGSSWLTVNVLVEPECDRQAAVTSVISSLGALLREEETLLPDGRDQRRTECLCGET